MAENVVTAMVTDEVFRNVMIFLHEHNIPPRFAKRIYEKYGSASLNNLLENPYRLEYLYRDERPYLILHYELTDNIVDYLIGVPRDLGELIL